MRHPFHLAPDMMVDTWRIKSRLGAGGFGAVFRVEAEGHPFALKFAAHGPGPGDVNHTDARAQRELACLVLIQHPNVVRVWAHGRWPHPTQGYHYVVMDYVEGPTLSDWVKLTRPTVRQVVRLFDTLALTLHALHAQGIHHRDLKGSNILVRASDEAPVLVDFGAAEHAVSASAAVPLTEGPLPPGTPHLRSPEALRFNREHYQNPLARYTFRPTDDLYALGATLYEALTGAPPFPPSLPRDILLALIESKVPPSPSATNPSVPPALGELVLRLLAKRPEDRPASGQQLHEAFQALLTEGSALDQPLSPSTDTVTTEGSGGRPPHFSSAPSPLRPPPPSPAPPPPSREPPPQAETPSPAPPSAPALPGPEPRAAASPSRPWRWSLAGLVLLCLVGAGLWRLSDKSLASPARSLAEPPPGSAGSPDAGAPLQASAPPDGGPFHAPSFPQPRAYEPPPSLLQEKGQSMRIPLKRNSPTPPEQQPARDGGSRAAAALLGLTFTCNLVTGCASVPVGPPDYQPCPLGSREVQEQRFGIESSPHDIVHLPGTHKGTNAKPEDYVTVSEGPNFVLFQGYRWAMPKGTRLIGEFILRDRLYGRLTEVELPDKTRLPFCGMLFDFNDGREGLVILPGSRPGALRVYPAAMAAPMRFDH